MAANLKAIMFCEFHPIAGPKIAYQVKSRGNKIIFVHVLVLCVHCEENARFLCLDLDIFAIFH